MPDLADLQRFFFDSLYTYRIQFALFSAVGAVVFVAIAARRGWFAAARRHPGRSAALLVVVLAVSLPVGWYLASPIFIRTELIEPDPVAAAAATPRPAASSEPGPGATAAPSPSAPATTAPATTAPATTAPATAAPATAAPATASPATAAPTPFAPKALLSGAFTGTDDFHFGRGTATIIETAPGTFVLRLAEFSVRNGPDLFVYLSPDPSDYVDGALELGRLKATDGSFGYALPPGTDPAEFASALIWCKQFSHLFAVAPFEPA